MKVNTRQEIYDNKLDYFVAVNTYCASVPNI